MAKIVKEVGFKGIWGDGAEPVFMGNGWRGIWGRLWYSCGIVHCVESSISCFLEIFIIAGKTFISRGGLCARK